MSLVADEICRQCDHAVGVHSYDVIAGRHGQCVLCNCDGPDVVRVYGQARYLNATISRNSASVKRNQRRVGRKVERVLYL